MPFTDVRRTVVYGTHMLNHRPKMKPETRFALFCYELLALANLDF